MVSNINQTMSEVWWAQQQNIQIKKDWRASLFDNRSYKATLLWLYRLTVTVSLSHEYVFKDCWPSWWKINNILECIWPVHGWNAFFIFLSNDCLWWHHVKILFWVVNSSERNWWLLLNVSISMLWSSSGECYTLGDCWRICANAGCWCISELYHEGGSRWISTYHKF